MNEQRSKPRPQRPGDTDAPGSDSPAAGLAVLPAGYPTFFADVKARIAAARTRAVLAVNSELIQLYWEIGLEILERQDREGWGAGVTKRLSTDLRREFADMKGLSETNLRHMRAFAQAWPDWEICSQAVSKLPWGHNLELVYKLADLETRHTHLKPPSTCADATRNTHTLTEVLVKIGSKKVADVKGVKTIKKGLRKEEG
jgi:predicted nuclease of restriction endonuclease-like (RecB) superfamily